MPESTSEQPEKEAWLSELDNHVMERTYALVPKIREQVRELAGLRIVGKELTIKELGDLLLAAALVTMADDLLNQFQG